MSKKSQPRVLYVQLALNCTPAEHIDHLLVWIAEVVGSSPEVLADFDSLGKDRLAVGSLLLVRYLQQAIRLPLLL